MISGADYGTLTDGFQIEIDSQRRGVVQERRSWMNQQGSLLCPFSHVSRSFSASCVGRYGALLRKIRDHVSHCKAGFVFKIHHPTPSGSIGNQPVGSILDSILPCVSFPSPFGDGFWVFGYPCKSPAPCIRSNSTLRLFNYSFDLRRVSIRTLGFV